MVELTVDKTQSLKQFTENHYAQASFYWNVLLKNKDVKVNGVKVGKDVTLYEGDVVRYYLTKKQEEKPAFYMVYEDENVAIVDKESGVNSEAVFATLLRSALGYRFIHRLDRNTRGLLAFAKTDAAETQLLRAFEERRVEKRYHALCFGAFARESETLTAYLKKDAEKAVVKIFDTPVAGGEKIVTEYRVLCQNQQTAKVEICLHTGKTHQIRAHLAHIGCPIVGDMKYGQTQKNRAQNVARQALVAKALSFKLEGELAYLNGKQFLSRFDVE